MSRGVAHDSVSLLGARVVAALSGVATSALLTRTLGPEGCGSYFLVIAGAFLATQLPGLGRGRFFTRFVP